MLRTSFTTSSASGITKATRIFMRSSGKDQVPASRSNSSQRANLTMWARALVMISSCAAKEAGVVIVLSLVISAGTSCHRKASKCSRFRAFFFSARLNRLSKCPRQRAGFSPSRRLRALAASRTCSICPRTSSAVLVLLAQIGCNTFSTWGVSISSADSLPM
ncbi:hypothetical protein D3C77_510440 [compost metagenome]